MDVDHRGYNDVIDIRPRGEADYYADIDGFSEVVPDSPAVPAALPRDDKRGFKTSDRDWTLRACRETAREETARAAGGRRSR